MTTLGVLYANDELFIADDASGVIWTVIPEAHLATLTLSETVKPVIAKAKQERGVLIPLPQEARDV